MRALIGWRRWFTPVRTFRAEASMGSSSTSLD
jgi:hypothetical protein